MTGLRTRFTDAFGLRAPLALAPMANAAGGALAAAVAGAGGLGLVGGGYGEAGWLRREWALATASGDAARIGCGFIAWRLDADAGALHWLLDQPVRPAAVLLSFGEPGAHARRILEAGVPLMVQVGRVADVGPALDAGARVIVVQGGEAGGHARAPARGTMALVPEAADLLAARAPDVLLLAAGGIADGRGLAAALVLGADGAMVGTRLWATREAMAADSAKAAALAASGDDSVRSGVFDILRRKSWPPGHDFRALQNALHQEWEGREAELREAPDEARAAYEAGVAAGDPERAHTPVGEAAGLLTALPPASEVVAHMVGEARAVLARQADRLADG